MAVLMTKNGIESLVDIRFVDTLMGYGFTEADQDQDQDQDQKKSFTREDLVRKAKEEFGVDLNPEDHVKTLQKQYNELVENHQG